MAGGEVILVSEASRGASCGWNTSALGGVRGRSRSGEAIPSGLN